jgi:hypothetical protein
MPAAFPRVSETVMLHPVISPAAPWPFYRPFTRDVRPRLARSAARMPGPWTHVTTSCRAAPAWGSETAPSVVNTPHVVAEEWRDRDRRLQHLEFEARNSQWLNVHSRQHLKKHAPCRSVSCRTTWGITVCHYRHNRTMIPPYSGAPGGTTASSSALPPTCPRCKWRPIRGMGLMDTFGRTWFKWTRREGCVAPTISLGMAKRCSELRCRHGVRRNCVIASDLPPPPDIAQPGATRVEVGVRDRRDVQRQQL